jgi:protein involved in polysaccharide export with SLBB domain
MNRETIISARIAVSLLTTAVLCVHFVAIPVYSQNAEPGTLPVPPAGQTAKSGFVPAQLNDQAVKFQPGDALKVTVFPDSTGFPNGLYRIDSDGNVDFPLIGVVRIVNFTPGEIQTILNEKYVKFLPQPNITVKPLLRISLLGGFYRPGLYWIDPRESIWNAVERAGGTQREDGIKKIRWERDTGIVTKDIVAYYQSGKSLYAIGFKSGDQLSVTSKPRQNFRDIFREDIVPVFSIISTVASIYITYLAYSTFTTHSTTAK